MFLKMTQLALSVLAVEVCSAMHLNKLVEIQKTLFTLHTGMVLVLLAHLVATAQVSLKSK